MAPHSPASRSQLPAEHPDTAEPAHSSPAARFVTRMTAASDHVLRGGVATLLAATMAPALLRSDSRAEAERLAFYAQRARSWDIDQLFAAPPGPPDGVRRRPLSPSLRPRVLGSVESVSFLSRFEPLHDAGPGQAHDRRRNGTVWVQHWRHDTGPRPTIIVCHGFLASPYLLNSAFLSLPWFHSHGHDVALITLPYHGRRSEPPWAFSGAGLFAHGLGGLTEGLLQAVHDLRSLIDLLRADGVDQIGVTGISLGGYLTAILAALDPDLAFAVPNCAVTDFSDLVHSWHPLGSAVEVGHRHADPDDLKATLRLHSPLEYPSRIPRDRRLIIHGEGDRLAPPSHGVALWEHWDRPDVHWFAGSHMLHVGQAAYLRRMGRFLEDIDFNPSHQRRPS